jgi:hypothetical protein
MMNVDLTVQILCHVYFRYLSHVEYLTSGQEMVFMLALQ